LSRKSAAILLAALLVGGCGSDGERAEAPPPRQQVAAAQPPTAPPIYGSSNPSPTVATNDQPTLSMAADPVIARVDKLNIRKSQITQPLIEGYGLNVLLNTVTLELAKQEAENRKLTVSPADIEAERDQTLAKMFKDASKEDYPNLLLQLLQQQRISRPEFDIVIATNAYLRKIAEPIVKANIDEDKLQEAFKALYGEKVRVRHIQCANLQEIIEAKRRLATGEPFEKVARDLSRNPDTKALGGELPPFSRYATGYPDNFKDAAFSLKIGEVSDPVEAGGVYHIIKLEERLDPKAVKFEDVKESLREDLTDRLTQAQIKNLRTQLIDRISRSMTVDDPTLAKQYEAKKNETDTAVHGNKDALDAIKRENRAANSATKPATPEDLRPPATMPGAAAPGAPTTKQSTP
jgi:foldase protein PrsA